MKIEVQGQQVEVDNDFASLSPEDQQKTVDDISAQLGHHETARSEMNQQREENAPNGFFDVGNAQSGARQIIDPIIGAGGLAAHAVGANPLTAGAAALGAYKYGAVKNLAQEGLNNWRNQNLTNMAESIRKGERFGQNVDAMKDAFKIQQEQQAARLAAQQAAQNQPGIIQRGMDYASQIRQLAAQKAAQAGPALGEAGQQVANFAQKAAPYINNPLTRGIAKLGGVGGQMATYSQGLNTNEEEELRRRRGMGPTIR
jgi:hypothetical protein